MSQFAFLADEFPGVFEHAKRTEDFARVDARIACGSARVALETAVHWMFRADGSLRNAYVSDLNGMLSEPSFGVLIGPQLKQKAHLIRLNGNTASHQGRGPKPKDGIDSARELFHFCYWLARTYAKGAKPDASITFSADTLPQNEQVPSDTLALLRKIAEQFQDSVAKRKAAEDALLRSEEGRAQLEEENARKKAEIAAIKKANAAVPDDHDYNEAETRVAYIDKLLREAGWDLDPKRDFEVEVSGMPDEADGGSGRGFVDYVLWGDDGKPLALIEAKRTRRDVAVGKHQATCYADCLEAQYGQRPVIFLSNGYEHWMWDDVAHPPRHVSGFYSKDELMLLHQRRGTRRPLNDVEIDTDIAGGDGRFYQARAIRRIGDAFEKDRQRKALLVMATGSGKTRTAIALVDQLMRAGWVKRVLFLADRKQLVKQAARAFNAHMPVSPPVNLLANREGEGRVYVSTYPTMMNLIDTMENGARRFGTGHFDLVIIDEAHRSVYQKYKAIFDYFDSLLVGLTATPRDEIDRDTYGLFDLEQGVPTDAYDLADAVSDGFLVPPTAMSVPLKFVRGGISYDDLSAEEKDQWDALEWDDEGGDPPDHVHASEVNKWLFNDDTIDNVLKHLMEHGLKVNDGDQLGKTIIFAKSHKHAVAIQARFDTQYPHWAGKFAQIIDNETVRSDDLIKKFEAKDSEPHIAISVDMLDTGIDIPEVLNLVFFKIIRSKTKFTQMIGRGTRLCADLLGPGADKETFRIFDFCMNFEYFGENGGGAEGSVGTSLGERLFLTRLEIAGAVDDASQAEASGQDGFANDGGEFDGGDAAPRTLAAVRVGHARRLHQEVAMMDTDNFIVRSERLHVEKYKDANAWKTLSLETRMEVANHIAGLPTAFEDNDIDAKRFDYLALSAQLACLTADPALLRYRKKITTIASALEKQASIPMVRAQIALIHEVQTDEYWQDVTVPMLEVLRLRLRELVKLVEKSERKIVYTSFRDEIGEGEVVTLPEVGDQVDKARFKRKVRQFLTNHADHIAILKLKRNDQLTAQDLAELERIFADEAEPNDTAMANIEQEGGLGLFIRSLVGLERQAAKRALGAVSEGSTLTADQIEFMDLIVEHLTERGVMETERLYESPFTDIDDQGVSGVFEGAEVTALVRALEEVRERAVA